MQTRGWHWNKILAFVLAVMFFAALAYDFAKVENRSELELALVGEGGADYVSELRIENVRFDDASRSIRGTLELNVTASRPGLEIGDVTFGFAKEPAGSTQLVRSSGCQSNVDPTGAIAGDQRLPRLELRCGEVILATARPREERLYPYDTYEIPFALRGCVNDGAGLCLEPGNMAFTKVVLAVADRDFVPRPSRRGAVAVTIGRRFIVQVVGVVFGLMAMVFLVYLVVVSDAREVFGKSLGLFATLWGLRALVVPASIKVFPTIVDYGVLALFAALFAIVLYRLPEGKRS